MINLSYAINCIKTMKENGTYEGEKIGRISIALNGFNSYKEGEIALFRDELDHSDFDGRYTGRKYTGRVTIESPLSPEEIKEQEAKCSLLTTIKTVINVPKKYIEEIVLDM